MDREGQVNGQKTRRSNLQKREGGQVSKRQKGKKGRLKTES